MRRNVSPTSLGSLGLPNWESCSSQSGVCPQMLLMARGNGTCVSTRMLSWLSWDPCQRGKGTQKIPSLSKAGHAQRLQENKSRDGNQSSATHVRRSLSPRTVCCALLGGGSPTSGHHACAESIVHQDSGLTAPGPTRLLSLLLSWELRCASPVYASCTLVGEGGLWQVFSSALFCFSFFCCFIYSSCCRPFSVFLDCPIRDCSFDLGTVVSIVLRCLHPVHPHHPVGPVTRVSPSPARERQA